MVQVPLQDIRRQDDKQESGVKGRTEIQEGRPDDAEAEGWSLGQKEKGGINRAWGKSEKVMLWDEDFILNKWKSVEEY